MGSRQLESILPRQTSPLAGHVMRKHLRLILLSVTLLVVTGYLALWLTAPGHRIAEKSFAAIQKGMTEKEVEAILGGKDGVYSSGAISGLYKVPGTVKPELGQGDWLTQVTEWLGLREGQSDCCVTLLGISSGQVI